MEKLRFKRIMIFGRPGSGKSTFASWLSRSLGMPLYHLDKYFYIENWIERDYYAFLQIQQNLVERDCWILDGNCIRSLEMRFAHADLVIYFNFSKVVCIFRIIKRRFRPNLSIEDRAPGCPEKMRLSLLKYTWRFERRVSRDIKILKELYPHAVIREIRNNKDLMKLKNELVKNP